MLHRYSGDTGKYATLNSMPKYNNEEYELPSDTVENGKLNRLRAAVLGANDGIVSVSAVVMGVAGAAVDSKAVAVSGLAALIAGALSMAVGEYVSVSSQSDAEKVYIEREKRELREQPERALETVKALKALAPEIRYQLAHAMRLRHVPELHFHYDESVDRGERIDNLLRDLRPSGSAE